MVWQQNMSSVNQILSYTGTKVHISCNYEDESLKWDSADFSQLLIVTTNPNVPWSCKWEKPLLSIPVPPPAPLGLHLWRLWKPFLLLFLMVNPSEGWMSGVMLTAGSQPWEQPDTWTAGTPELCQHSLQGQEPFNHNHNSDFFWQRESCKDWSYITAGLRVKSHAGKFRGMSPCASWIQSLLPATCTRQFLFCSCTE